MTKNKYEKYDGKKLSDLEHLSDRSEYCKNYYKGIGCEVIFADSDDDNRTYYRIVGDDVWFAESLSSEGNVIHVFQPESMSKYI